MDLWYIGLLDSRTNRRRPRSFPRACLFTALLFPAAVPAVRGQSLLLKVPGTLSPPGVQFTTPTASRDASPRLTAVDAALTVVFDASVLDGPQGKTWSAGLAALYSRNRNLSLELVALAPGVEPREASATSRQQVASAIRSLASGGAASGEPLTFAALLAYVRSVASPAAGWKQLVYVGPEPPLAPELREYGHALLLRTLLGRRIRFSHCYAEGAVEPAWAPALRATAGDVVPSLPADIAAAAEQTWFEVTVPEWAPPQGFRALPLAFRVGTENARRIPWLWSGSPDTLPQPAAYGEFLKLRAGVAANPAGARAEDLSRLLAVNPYDL